MCLGIANMREATLLIDSCFWDEIKIKISFNILIKKAYQNQKKSVYDESVYANEFGTYS